MINGTRVVEMIAPPVSFNLLAMEKQSVFGILPMANVYPAQCASEVPVICVGRPIHAQHMTPFVHGTIPTTDALTSACHVVELSAQLAVPHSDAKYRTVCVRGTKQNKAVTTAAPYAAEVNVPPVSLKTPAPPRGCVHGTLRAFTAMMKTPTHVLVANVQHVSGLAHAKNKIPPVYGIARNFRTIATIR